MKTLISVGLLAAAVTVNRYDRAATGANTGETILNAQNVSATGFGKLYSYYVDGAVYAQPLYAPGLDGHNALYVATMNDKVYAFDADALRAALRRLRSDNAQAELYLTDAIEILRRDDMRVRAQHVDDSALVAGVNDRVQLAELAAELNRRIEAFNLKAPVSSAQRLPVSYNGLLNA